MAAAPAIGASAETVGAGIAKEDLKRGRQPVVQLSEPDFYDGRPGETIMKRIAMTVMLKDDPEVIRRYEELHADPWPEVLKSSDVNLGIH